MLNGNLHVVIRKVVQEGPLRNTCMNCYYRVILVDLNDVSQGSSPYCWEGLRLKSAVVTGCQVSVNPTLSILHILMY
jgi:hypothetical protein